MRGDAEPVARRQRRAAVEIGMPEGLFEDELAPVGDGDDAARLLRLAQLKLDPARDVVERRRQPFVHRSLFPRWDLSVMPAPACGPGNP